MRLIAAYGKNGKIFSIWRVSPKNRKYRFHKGDRMICEIEAECALRVVKLSQQSLDKLKGHQPLIDGLLHYINLLDYEQRNSQAS